MRIQVEYEDNGRITHVGTVGEIKHSDGSVSRCRLMSRPGRHVVEVDSDEVTHERDVDGLRRVVDIYQIVGHPHDPHLTKRDA